MHWCVVFRIKICGITRNEDLAAVTKLGVDAVGLNFYAPSKRYVSAEKASELIAEETPLPIGVFVNADAASIRDCVNRCRLQGIQLHGDEPPKLLAELPNLPIIRARRIDGRGVAAIAEDLAACEAAGRMPDAVLVDAYAPGEYGGTGETVAWAELADYREWLGNIPLILAGGLTAENVTEAIHTVRPSGVDTASGVESSPGVKDPAKMQSFISTARAAFDQIHGE